MQARRDTLACKPASNASSSAAATLVEEAAAAQRRWAAIALRQRLRVLRRFRRRLASDPLAVAATIERRDVGETIVSEIWPLLEASRYLERRAPRALADRRPRPRGWPLPGRSRVRVIREPYGVVLIIGPGNYGLMLAAVQALAALAAGNAAVVKPAPGARAALERFASLLMQSGLPPKLLTVVDEDAETARALLEAGVDRVVFTGSSAAGRDVLIEAAARLVPAALELSGWDACIVLDDANLDRVADALVFALRSNRGETCVAPRRVIVDAGHAAELEERLCARLRREAEQPFSERVAARARTLVGDALSAGARLVHGRIAGGRVVGPLVLADVTRDMAIFSTEVFAPIVLMAAVDDPDSAVALANGGEHALGASVFGSTRRARAIASRLRAGLVTINDVVAPLADPEVPLAPRGASGFGVTRGAEGLVAMTRPKAVTEPRSRFAPHHTLCPQTMTSAVAAFMTLLHGDPRARPGALRALLAALEAARRARRDERLAGRPRAKLEERP